MAMMMVDMEEEDGYVYKGRAVAVEVVVHERLERDVDDHWYDLSKALASFAKNDLQQVLLVPGDGESVAIPLHLLLLLSPSLRPLLLSSSPPPPLLLPSFTSGALLALKQLVTTRSTTPAYVSDAFLTEVRDAAKALGMEMGEVIMTREEDLVRDLEEDHIMTREQDRVKDLEKHSSSEVVDTLESSSKADEADESSEEEEEEELEDVDELLKEDLPVMANSVTDIADEFHLDDEEDARKESSDKDVEMKEHDDDDDDEEEEVEDESDDAEHHSLLESSNNDGEINATLDETQEKPKDVVEEIKIEGKAEVGEPQENLENSETDDDELGSDSENSSAEKENSIVTDVEKIEKLKVELNEEIKMPSYREIVPEELEQTDSNRSQVIGCPCPICDFNPSAPAKLKEHLAQKHFAENIKADYMKDDRQCLIEECEKEFANSGSLVRHIGSTHGKVVNILRDQGFEVPEYLLSANYMKGRKMEVQVTKEDESVKVEENEEIAETENEDIAVTETETHEEEEEEEEDDCVPSYDGELGLDDFIPENQEDEQETEEKPEDEQETEAKPEDEQETEAKPEDEQETEAKPDEQEEAEQPGVEPVESLGVTVVPQKVLKLDRLDRLDNLEKLNRLDNLDVTLNSYETKQQENENTLESAENDGLVCPVCGVNPNTPAKLREHMAYKHFTENIKASFMKEERRCLVDECTKEFTNMSSLVRHIGSTHNKVVDIMREENIQVPLGLLDSWKETKKREREESLNPKKKKMRTM